MNSKKRSRNVIPEAENLYRTLLPPRERNAPIRRPRSSYLSRDALSCLFLCSLLSLQNVSLVANALLNPAPPLRVRRHQHHRQSPLQPHFFPASPLTTRRLDCPSSIGSRRSGVTVYDSETEIEITMPTVNGSTATAASASSVNGVNGLSHHEHQQHHNGNVDVHATANGATHVPPFFTTELLEDSPRPTDKGGYSHTLASKAKISAANKGKTPWNKGRARSEEERAKIASGVRAKNRVRFLQKLSDMGVTEEEYEANKKEERREKDAERRSRRTEKGGYRPTEETRQKISQILKEKYANGEVKPRTIDPSKVRRGFKHTEETRAKISEALRKRWAEDPEYRATMTEKVASANADITVRQKISASLRKKWQEPEFRAEMMEKMSNRKGKTGLAHDQSHREKISAAMRAKWQDEEYRQKAMDGIAKRQEALSKTRPLKPRTSPGSPVRASKTRVPKTPAVHAPAATAATEENDVGDPPSFSPFAPPVRGEGLQLVEPRTIPREPKKRKGRKKGTKNKPKPAVAKTVKVAPKQVVTDSDGNQTPAEALVSSGENGQDGEADTESSTTGKKSSKKPNGSVSRLREERRDLYDLLYGDEDEAPASASTGSNSNSNVMANLPLGDDNLDEFDPYGLDDF
jgi:hypothetical protein